MKIFFFFTSYVKEVFTMSLELIKLSLYGKNTEFFKGLKISQAPYTIDVDLLKEYIEKGEISMEQALRIRDSFEAMKYEKILANFPDTPLPKLPGGPNFSATPSPKLPEGLDFQLRSSASHLPKLPEGPSIQGTSEADLPVNEICEFSTTKHGLILILVVISITSICVLISFFLGGGSSGGPPPGNNPRSDDSNSVVSENLRNARIAGRDNVENVAQPNIAGAAQFVTGATAPPPEALDVPVTLDSDSDD